jgi:DNA helicase-4
MFLATVESVVAEERRIFYVALTRAMENLFILTEKGSFSPFLEDLEKNIKLSRLAWSDYLPLEGKIQYITIKIGNQNGRGSEPTKKIKELLKPKGYRWDGETWYSIRPAEGFSVKAFADQDIWDLADGIEVGFYDYLDNEIALYHVDGGQWRCINDDIRESDD